MTESRTVDILRDLVAFDTTSRESNNDLIDYAEELLGAAGGRLQRIPSPDGVKSNLFASFGPDTDDGVILSGHTDCVPVDGQQWSTDPFVLTDGGDGRWYGRGTADMKGFVAVVMAAVEGLDLSHLTRPIHVALSYDEEVDGNGARVMVDALAKTSMRANACIVGEPSSMQVVTDHKGIFLHQIDIVGTPAHSSLAPLAVNAIEYGADVVTYLRDLAVAKAADGPFVEGYPITHTTVHVGMIDGGTAPNIVPKNCTVLFEFRHLPEDDPVAIHDLIYDEVARLDKVMKERSPEAGMTVEQHATLPHLKTAETAPVVGWLQGLTNTDLGKVTYGTEAGIFADGLDVPTVVCGPGSIEQAHRRDEFVDNSELEAADSFMARLVEDLSG